MSSYCCQRMGLNPAQAIPDVNPHLVLLLLLSVSTNNINKAGTELNR